MISIPLDNPYALLGLTLSPRTDNEILATIEEAIRRERVSWEELLCQANLNYCTPLWYVRLHQKNLLHLVPSELREYLRLLHQANSERNAAFRQALKELLVQLQERSISSVLLKGAATFSDDLYGDAGARMLGDLDFLVAPDHLTAVRDVMTGLGYREVLEEQDTVHTPAYRSHHLPRLHKTGTPVDAEVHFGVARGHKGRVFPAELAWRCREEASFEGLAVSILDPTRRLLHNAVHALVAHRRFISSNISMRDLAEFAAIVHRCGPAIAWSEWFHRGAVNGLGGQFHTYLVLSFGLAGLPLPEKFSETLSTRLQVYRILAAAKYGRSARAFATAPDDGLKGRAVRFWVKTRYHLSLPLWLWRGPCYAEGIENLPMRMRCMAANYRQIFRKKIASRRAREPSYRQTKV